MRSSAERVLAAINCRIVSCRLCPRLVAWRERIALEKKREFAHCDYWGRPVPGFGDPNARLLVIGLAPAAHGGNRTGRMFTGDWSGRWLFRALYRAGFANQPSWERCDDGLRLKDCYITAVIHCAPPGNHPLPGEIARCNVYLREELRALRRVRVVVALGHIAFETYCRTAGLRPIPRFEHNGCYNGCPMVIASYHPSRQNTNTGRLTEEMLDAVFARAKAVLAGRNKACKLGGRDDRAG
ncbi:MAG: uracil-DNA glycosylase [Verrucomicrobiae bacterium]|nr:uracil-DNA glycosylase [Verrucomicrobiae bacterium]